MKELLLLPGDGIGPEVIAAAVAALREAGFKGPTRQLDFGLGCWERSGVAVPEATLEAVKAAGVALLGAATTPEVGCASPILELRRRLGLDLMLRPTPGGGPTLLIHSFAGLYAEAEDPGPPAVSRWTLHPHQADRLLDEAFRIATRSVTVVDKPTVRRHAAAMFREAARGRPMRLMNADAFCAAVVRDMSAFDVVACTSFVGDVLSDLLAALRQGMPAAASVSFGEQVAVFEPVHGSAPHLVGSGRVDKRGAVRAAAMLMRQVGETAIAERLEWRCRHAPEGL